MTKETDNEDEELSLQESLQTLQDLLLADLIDLLQNRKGQVASSDRMAVLRVLQHYGAGTGEATATSVEELQKLLDDTLPDDANLYEDDDNVIAL